MKGLLPAIFSILVGLPVLSQTPELPAELKVFVKQGFTVLDYAKGNLDDDAIPDYVMVLAQEGEDTITFRDSSWMIHRIAVLLKGNADFLKPQRTKKPYCAVIAVG